MAYVTRDLIKPALVNNQALGMEQETFDSLLDTLIKWTEAEINSFLGKVYSDSELAADTLLGATLESVVFQAVDNFLLSVVQRRTAPIITIGEFKVTVPPRVILTAEMKESLERWRVAGLPCPVFIEGVKRFHSDVSGIFNSAANQSSGTE